MTPLPAVGARVQLTGTTAPWVKLPPALGAVTVGVGWEPAWMVKGASEASKASQLPAPSTYQTRTVYPVPAGWDTVQS